MIDLHADSGPDDPAGPFLPGVGLSVRVPQFEGPLDLLLHLVRSNDMDILDISIVEIARQYNAYLDRMAAMDLEIASEYLVTAATLAHIKSRLMLPPEATEDGQPPEDPRAELTRQLLRFEQYRKAAEGLGALEEARDLIFTRGAPPPPELAGAVLLKADLADLVAAFERVLSRLEADERVEVIRREDVKIQDLMARLLECLDATPVASFFDLLKTCRTRLERVVLFLALLELVRVGSIAVWQPAPRGDIAVELVALRPTEEIQ